MRVEACLDVRWRSLWQLCGVFRGLDIVSQLCIIEDEGLIIGSGQQFNVQFNLHIIVWVRLWNSDL